MIIDTNALSAFFDGEKALVSVLASTDEVYLPVIVLGEYRYGLRGSKLRKQFEPQLMSFAKACTVLAILETTTQFYATIRHGLRKQGTPIPENDVWIAALALEYGLPVLSNDLHFDSVQQIDRIGW
ncbi:MAG: type II toxin-antitoxin system VapC family toxin [Verrucomicrobia bacterium]|nr:type II toxin-antitoxin system VapC family toxin [Verrucomicrobiota bacterium]MDA1068817.1 type II toxin-antitoxin system VapC family toxin [Verrucomicrobiota bacterium]